MLGYLAVAWSLQTCCTPLATIPFMRIPLLFLCWTLSSGLFGQGVSLASIDAHGFQGDQAATNPSISEDGRFVAFASAATNFDPRPPLSVSDIFLHDRYLETTILVSQATTGGRSAGGSFRPVISGDGRWIVFQSIADDLVPFDTNGCLDVFLYDRILEVMKRVSVDSNGMEGDHYSVEASISHSGTIITFASDATNLVPGDVNRNSDVFVYERLNGNTTRISASASGVGGNWDSFSRATPQ